MQADTRTLQQILHGDRRFVVPVYQRPYVWDREQQWEPLWNDIESTAVRLAETRVSAHQEGTGVAEADRKAPPHFLGAIVLEQSPTATGDLEVRHVVDGQQRLTTLMLVLRGVLDALQEADADPRQIAKVRKLIRNDEEVVSGDALHKVWPRPADRIAYLAAIAPARPAAPKSRFEEARVYFAQAATEFLAADENPIDPYAEGTPVQQRASLLAATLLGLVKLVVIDLEDVDDAQVIFEALNARNTPLSATDLVKNLLFMRAQAQRHDSQKLYERVWARFDRDEEWWRAPVGVGHAQRARQDWLLGDWLIAHLGRVINVGRLYGEFRRWLEESRTPPVEALSTLNRYADAYEALHGRQPGPTPSERLAFKRIDLLNITVATPVLLWLLVQPENVLPRSERELAFRAIESYVVRRMAVKWQTRGYGTVFADVLRAGRSASEHPGFAIIEALRAGPHGYNWPSDADLMEQFRTTRYYGPGGINQERLRLLLSAVDARLQHAPHKGEPVSINYDVLQIEHIIPRGWKEFWPVMAENEAERMRLEQQRESHVHRIGNLTLVSSLLNPSLSNNPWEAKRDGLRKHSHLRLNALLCEQDEWDEERIVQRGEWLARMVAEAWPGPASGAWTKS
ncbi:MAG TPA: DUF262 domain-containing HNH endonuclease family protein [Longimicrobium sp.]|jgi:hypothetical protein|uniref:DUF262 domain-containing protein n=1 Tax=Longimicrobium sp. TaxID=2029185 RepID=UPI002EDA232C